MKSRRRTARRVRLTAGWAGALAVAGLVLFPGTVRAQEEHIDTPYRWIERGTRVGLYGGLMATDRGQPAFGPGASTTLGARFRTRISSPLSFELGFGFGDADMWVIEPRLEGGPAAVDTVDSKWLIVQASLQLALTGARSYHRVQPYIVLGGGILRELSAGSTDALESPKESFEFRIGTAPMVHLGVGAELDVSRKLGLALEARDNLWRMKAPDGWFQIDVLGNIVDAGAPAPKESQWTHNLEVTAGLYYYF